MFIPGSFFPGAYQVTAAAEVMEQFLFADNIGRGFILKNKGLFGQKTLLNDKLTEDGQERSDPGTAGNEHSRSPIGNGTERIAH